MQYYTSRKRITFTYKLDKTTEAETVSCLANKNKYELVILPDSGHSNECEIGEMCHSYKQRTGEHLKGGKLVKFSVTVWNCWSTLSFPQTGEH